MPREPLAAFPAPFGAPPQLEGKSASSKPPASPLPGPTPLRLRLHLLLFIATLVSMQLTAMAINAPPQQGYTALQWGAFQAVPLLAILVVHELGHYVAARLHHVPASLPYFVPLPFVGLFGTLGAVITMDDRIRSRRALLDIGAAGPIAGMLVAVPVLCWGLSLSHVEPRALTNYTQEGQSILYWLLKRLVLGPIPDTHDVRLHPMAFAGWGGLFLTMINLLPWGQLDGGHIAYALLGERQQRLARWIRHALLLPFAYNLIVLVIPVLVGRSQQPFEAALMSSTFWLVWYGVTGLMSRVSGPLHPPFEPAPLDPARKVVGALCLLLFVLLFLPTPLAIY
jgi:membrane-associated protease RseP (regulator of RpoE activity)